MLAVVYVLGSRWFGISPDGFFAAIGFGVATCVFPWFLVYPALGFGSFGRNGPPELKLFRTSVVNHFFYGLGLWVMATVLPLA